MLVIPFSGSKKFSYKKVKEIVEKGEYTSIYEPFGGSCVLSVNLYNDGVVDKAVANDYDHFFDLYPEYLDLKDLVVKECNKQGIYGSKHDGKGIYRLLPNGQKKRIKSRCLRDEQRITLQRIIKENVPEKYWRYFSLGGNFMYSSVSSHEKIKLNDFILFDAYLNTDKQRKYLEVLNKIELEHLDWHDFIYKHKNSIDKNSLLILDPPYIGTYQEQYKGGFSINETVELLNTIKDLDCDFIFFNHNPNEVKEWLASLNYELFFTGNAAVTANRKRKDVMAYVKVN